MSAPIERDPARYLGVLRRAFDRHYGERSDVWTQDPAMRAFPPQIHAQVGLSSSARVLDVGCGAGPDVEYFAGVCARVEGIDLHPHAAWAGIAAAHPNVRFRCVDLLGLAEDERFDLVFDNGCFHHQHPDHYPAYLARVGALLAPGGHYVLSTFKNPAVTARVDDHGRLHRYFSDEELADVLAEAGLAVVHTQVVRQVARDEHYRLTYSQLR